MILSCNKCNSTNLFVEIKGNVKRIVLWKLWKMAKMDNKRRTKYM